MLAALAAPAAQARVRGHDIRGTLEAGPAVAGSRFIWVEGDRRGRLRAVSMPVRGGPVRTERWLAPMLRRAQRKSDRIILIDGSERRRVSLVSWQDPDAPDVGPDADVSYSFSRMITAPAGGAASRLSTCTKGTSDTSGMAVAASGNFVSWLSECGSESELRTLDFSRGADPRPVRVKARPGRWFVGLVQAGRYALSLPTGINNLSPDGAVVYDMRSGRRFRRFGDLRRRRVQSASIDRTGRMAVTYGRDFQQDEACRPAIHALVINRRGKRRRLSGRPCFGDIETAAGRVLLRTFVAPYAGPLTGPLGESTITRHVLINLSKGTRRPVTRPFVTGTEELIFTGGRIAYTFVRCDGRLTVGSITVRAAARRPLAPDLCRGRVGAPAPRQSIGARRRVRVTVTCPTGCESFLAAVRLYVPDERRYLQIQGERLGPDRIWMSTVSAPAKRPKSATIELSEAAAAEVRRRGSLKTQAQLVVYRYDGSEQISSVPVELVP